MGPNILLQNHKPENQLIPSLWSTQNTSPTCSTDIEFKCKNGQVKSHKLYLKQCCTLFKHIFSSDHFYGQDFVVILPDFETREVSQFLELLYTGKTNLASNTDYVAVRQISYLTTLSKIPDQNDQNKVSDLYRQQLQENLDPTLSKKSGNHSSSKEIRNKNKASSVKTRRHTSKPLQRRIISGDISSASEADSDLTHLKETCSSGKVTGSTQRHHRHTKSDQESSAIETDDGSAGLDKSDQCTYWNEPEFMSDGLEINYVKLEPEDLDISNDSVEPMKRRKVTNNFNSENDEDDFTSILIGENGERKYKCDHCSSKFKHKYAIIKHVRTVHENWRPYSCDKCDAKFKERCHLKYHLNNVHR